MADSKALQFTLGLTAGGFLTSLSQADSRLKGFIGSMLSFGAVTAGVWNQIEKGAQLKALSDQTGESVGTLYKMQRGLKSVGLDAESTGSMIFRLQTALGGVSESGEPTAYVFGQLGLRIEDLKKLNAPDALQQIAGKLAKLDAAGATAAAGKIFGRYSAREFLQLSRNADDFTRALKGSAIQAAIFQRYGETFHQIEIGLGRIKEKGNALFLGIAAGVAPALQNVIAMLDKIDLTGIGKDLGTILTAFTQAFREGKLSELIGNSLKLGFDSILIFAPAIFEKAGYMLLKAFETPLNYLQAGMTWALTQFAHNFNNPTMEAALTAVNPALAGISKYIGYTDAASFGDVLKEQKEKGLAFNFGFGQMGLGDIDDEANKKAAEALKKFKEASKPLWDEITNLATRATTGLNKDNKAASPKEALGTPYHPERTALEKLGFVFRSGAGASDPAKETAKNTRETVIALRTLIARPLAYHPLNSAINAHA